MHSFKKRHPELVQRISEGVRNGPAIIMEDRLRKCGGELEEYMVLNNFEYVLEDPSRIMNVDKTSFSMCLKTGKAGKASGHYQMCNENVTITVC